MRRIILIIMVAIIAFSGCRKGEDDPFFSFKSRTNRLCGNWRLAEFNMKVYIGVGLQVNYSYEIQMLAGQAKVLFQGTEVDAYSYIENWEINKEGVYSITTKTSGNLYEESGKWSWCGKDKNREYKKKEYLYLTCTKYVYNKGEEVAEYSGNSLSPSRMIAITRLSSDEILLLEENTINESDNTPRRIKTISRLIKTGE
jgi:hypothetical protein